MATITLKNIPNELYKRLKLMAKLNHRSLNSEIIYSLEKSLGITQEDPQELRSQLENFRNRLAGRGSVTDNEIEKALNDGRT